MEEAGADTVGAGVAGAGAGERRNGQMAKVTIVGLWAEVLRRMLQAQRTITWRASLNG